MVIGAVLGQQLDSRHGGDDCLFNGYLEDYLSLNGSDIDPTLLEAFTRIQEQHPNVRICTGLKSELNRNAISNQIIRYKDIFKLEGKPLVYPHILYETRENESRALLVVPYEKHSYLFAKGYYYCMTEPGNLFLDCKNDIVVISSNNATEICETYDLIFAKKAGAIQRGIDHRYFTDYSDLKTKAMEAAEIQKEKAYSELKSLQDRSAAIYNYVIKWFLLKKVVYVQYMVNKDILTKVHDGNIKRQRNQAKLNADAIQFISYSEMWRTNGEPLQEVPEE